MYVLQMVENEISKEKTEIIKHSNDFAQIITATLR